MLFPKLSAALLLASVAHGACTTTKTVRKRELGGHLLNEIILKVTNQAYQQPFSGFFVMTHNEDAAPLFECGGEASEQLALLAENGDPSHLVEHYTGADGVGYVAAHTEGAPYFGGENTYISVPGDPEYPYVTIASMAVNTNDCFVALNGVHLLPGTVVDAPGYDAGSEENNELCASVPGPACAADTGNERSGNGEGFVHVHRGFFGIGGELSQVGYDWRNPMMRVAMMEAGGEGSGDAGGHEGSADSDEGNMPHENSEDF